MELQQGVDCGEAVWLCGYFLMLKYFSGTFWDVVPR